MLGILLDSRRDEQLRKVRSWVSQLWSSEKEAGASTIVEVRIRKWSPPRSLSSNALLWALCELIANEQNAGVAVGPRTIMVTKEDVYEALLAEFESQKGLTGPAVTIGGVGRRQNLGSSRYDQRTMNEFLDYIFIELASMGVSVQSSKDILEYWKQWRQRMSAYGVILHEGEDITGREYRSRVPICEATGVWLGGGGGSLAHIVARGMGGNPEEEKDKTGNWMHLCDRAHAEWDNGKGREAFLVKYPWCSAKIMKALKKEVETHGENE